MFGVKKDRWLPAALALVKKHRACREVVARVKAPWVLASGVALVMAQAAPAFAFPVKPSGYNQTLITGYWPKDSSSSSPYYNLGGGGKFFLTCSTENAYNTRWLPGTDGKVQDSDSIEALYYFKLDGKRPNGGFYQYDVNNNVYNSEPNGWVSSGTSLTAQDVASCYGLTAGDITNFSVSGDYSVDIKTSDFYGVTFDYQGYRYSLGVSANAAVNTRIALNKAPTVTGAPTSVSVIEDVASNVDLSTVSFADQDGDSLTVDLTVSSGSFELPTGGSDETATLTSTNAVRLVGLAGDINDWLNTASNLRYTTATDAQGPGVATLTISAFDGIDGLVANPTVIIDATNTPDVVNVTSVQPNGHYKAGDVIDVQVEFDTAVIFTDAPTLTLATGGAGRSVSYFIGSGGSTLTFRYTVEAGDTSADLDYVAASSLSGATIVAAVGDYAADVTLPAPGAKGSLGANQDIVIDTTAPVVTDPNISLSGATGSGDVFKVGDIVTASWIAPWAKDGDEGDANLSSTVGSVTIDFVSFGEKSPVRATLSDGKWTASYKIAAETSVTGSGLNVSVTATDGAGNTTTTGDTTGATVDATPPVLSTRNITISGATGTGGAFRVGDTVTVVWDDTASGDNNPDTESVTVDFTQFGGGLVSATESEGKWTATYSITEGTIIDATARNVVVTAFDKVGNSSDANGPGGAVVDEILPTVVDGDITVSGGTMPSGAFRIGDTVTVSWTANNTDGIDVVTVNLSGFGGPSGAVASLDGKVWKATYQLVEGLISSLEVEVAVTATDNAGNTLTTTKLQRYTANTLVPSPVVTGPTEVVTTRFSVTIEFNEDVFGDLDDTELRVENGTVASVIPVVGSKRKFTAEIDPELGNMVLVQVTAGAVENSGGNQNAVSNEFTVFAGTPATAFDKYRDEIQQVLVDEAERSLRSTLSANQRMTRGARDRFIAADQQAAGCEDDQERGATSDTQECEREYVSDVPFDVDGSLDVSGATVSTKGTFFQQSGYGAGSSRRLFFGDFDIQSDSETGSRTATLNARIAWEQMVSDQTMLGYFIGGELAQSSIAGSFDGDQNRIGVNVGGYAVHQLAEQVYLDGFLSFGAGRNNLEIANDELALESDYTTRSASAGAALSGVIKQDGFEILPELAVSYGRTWIGEVGFTGRAYGLVDDTLSLDAGTVSIANIMFRPEFRVPLDDLNAAESLNLFTFAPRFICEQVTATTTVEDCGTGAEIGISARSQDGLSTINAAIIADWLDERSSSSLLLNLEHRF